MRDQPDKADQSNSREGGKAGKKKMGLQPADQSHAREGGQAGKK
jgi:hypothetical protein